MLRYEQFRRGSMIRRNFTIIYETFTIVFPPPGGSVTAFFAVTDQIQIRSLQEPVLQEVSSKFHSRF